MVYRRDGTDCGQDDRGGKLNDIYETMDTTQYTSTDLVHIDVQAKFQIPSNIRI